jgi:hypothetical protein
MFTLNWTWKIVCSNAAGGYASSSIATGRVTQAGQVSVEEPDKECPMTEGREGFLEFCLPLSRSTPQNQNLALKVGVWA